MKCAEPHPTGRGYMNKLFGSLAVAIVAAGLCAVAQDTPKQEAKKAGSDVKEAGKASGRAVKHTGKAIGKGTKKGVHKAAAGTEKGAEKVKDKTKQ